MPRYDDRYGNTRLYVGHLGSRTRSHDLEDIFSRYGRVRDVDMKRDYAFVEFSDPRDADDARHHLNGRDVDGSRIIVEVAKGTPRGAGGSRDFGCRGGDFGGRGPPPGTGRCFNCGLDGHWARDCKAGDWKNKCYKCGERGHIERNCQNSPKKVTKRGRSYSRSPSTRRGRSRSLSHSRSYSRSRSPVRRERDIEREDKRSKSPRRRRTTPPPSKGRKRSPSPDERSPRDSSLSPRDKRAANGSDYSKSPNGRRDDEDIKDRSPLEDNGRSRDESPRTYEDDARSNGGESPGGGDRSPLEDRSPLDEGNQVSPRGGSESA